MTSRPSKRASLETLAQQVGGTVEGEGALLLHGVAPLEVAQPHELSFLLQEQYRPQLATTQAGAILLGQGVEGPPQLPLLRVPHPPRALAQIMAFFYPPNPPAPGVDPLAHIEAEASVHPEARIEPFAYVGPRAEIGEGAWLHPFVYVGAAASVGARAILYPGAVLMERCQLEEGTILHAGAVVGAEGFGVLPSNEGPVRLPHQGRVCVGPHSEIGANSTVDRATWGETKLAEEVFLDNLVQIGHNCSIGPRTLIAGQAGVAGSSHLGADVQIGGQAGIGDHLHLGDGAKVAGGSGVIRDVPPGEEVAGYPALPRYQWLRIWSHLRRLLPS